MSEQYTDDRVSNGMRIKYYKYENILQSQKVYSDGTKQIRIQIYLETMTFCFLDASTGFTFFTSEPGITNLEVLQRHVKKELKKMLKIQFEKEVRAVTK
jgi:hypothetical protein